MKRLPIVFLILAMAMLTSMAWADYNVGVTWTHSAGPNHRNTKIFLDSVEKCDVLDSESAVCNFVLVGDLAGQVVSAESFNTQDVSGGVYSVGTLLSVPAQATGFMFTITVIP